MTTATSPITVTSVERIRHNDDAMTELTDGLANAAAGLRIDGLPADSEHRAVHEWERVVIDLAIDEIAEDVADLLNAAIEKRLPWSYPE